MTGETLKTVEKALQVLRAFSREDLELSVAEIARRVGASRTAITRILVTLERAGYLERASNGLKYRIGFAACEVGALYLIGNPLPSLAAETLKKLADVSGYTAYLGRLYGDEVVVLGVREGRQPIRFLWSAGDRLPVTTTATGKAMLMHLSQSEIDGILGSDRLAELTPRSIRTRAELDRQLKASRERGWVPMVEESYPGICGVGAAVLLPDGRPVAGLGLSFLGSGFDAAEFGRNGALIVEAARDLSNKLSAQSSYRS
jgi:DNA-binding IclR family transcriptional regulator